MQEARAGPGRRTSRLLLEKRPRNVAANPPSAGPSRRRFACGPPAGCERLSSAAALPVPDAQAEGPGGVPAPRTAQTAAGSSLSIWRSGCPRGKQPRGSGPAGYRLATLCHARASAECVSPRRPAPASPRTCRAPAHREHRMALWQEGEVSPSGPGHLDLRVQ